MIETKFVQPGIASAVAEEHTGSGISWPAIFAGSVVSFALTLVLLAFGTGIGLSSISPWGSSGISATTFKVASGLYLVVIAMISSAIGGYLAGRLRSRWTGVHADEVYFRDTAHGFIAWAFASVLGAVLLASPVTQTVSGAVTGAAQGAAASAQSGSMDGYIDTLLRPTTPSAQANSGDARGELGRLFTTTFRGGGADMKAPDREYVAKVVAARTGISQAEAAQRVEAVLMQAKADLDAARKATAALAFWLTASLLIGAFSASLAATEGGGLRDGTWPRKKSY